MNRPRKYDGAGCLADDCTEEPRIKGYCTRCYRKIRYREKRYGSADPENMAQPQMSESDIDDAVQKWESDWSIADISEALGFSQSCIRHRLRSRGIEVEYRRPLRVRKDAKRALRLRDAGKSYRDIGLQLDCSQEWARRLVLIANGEF